MGEQIWTMGGSHAERTKASLWLSSSRQNVGVPITSCHPEICDFLLIEMTKVIRVIGEVLFADADSE
jgi:hypothetical protein